MDDNTLSNCSISPDDLSIQTNVHDLTCIICLNICHKPVLITCCERLMCLNCIKMMVKLSTNLKCPHCNCVNLKFEKPSKIINRMYENLTFYCSNKSKGCCDTIKYSFYNDHVMNECQYRISSLKYCKKCMEIYNINFNHICGEKEGIGGTLLEQTLNSIYTVADDPCQKLKKNEADVINTPKLHNHDLVFTANRLNSGYEQGWCCELCNDNIRNPTTPSYHCEACVFDICEKCYIYIFSRTPNTNTHNHTLNLEIRDLEWECNICTKSYYMRRSWYCDICDFDTCVFCYWK